MELGRSAWAWTVGQERESENGHGQSGKMSGRQW